MGSPGESGGPSRERGGDSRPNRKQFIKLASLASAAGMLGGIEGVGALTKDARSQEKPSASKRVEGKPNFLIVMDDDGRDDLAELGGIDRIMGGNGINFTNAFVTLSLCGPARVSFLRGQYAHNHTVWNNTGPHGGYEGMKRQGIIEDNLSTWMQAAGYRNIYIGKYNNGYFKANAREIPDGWDEWYAALGGARDIGEVSNNGEVEEISGNSSKALGKRAEEFIDARKDEPEPWMCFVAVEPPHSPPEVESQYEDARPKLKAPKGPNFNEKDVSDKPRYLRKQKRLSNKRVQGLNELYRNRARSLMSLRDALKGMIQKLSETGQLENTYIFFVSDNGYHIGNHRFYQGKLLPYEEDISIPFYVRGPGISPGSNSGALVTNNDFAPTIADLAGAKIPDYVDGASLAPLLFGETKPGWRRAIGLEGRFIDSSIQAVPKTPTRYGVRTATNKLVKYPGTKEYEWYNLAKDRQELESRSVKANRKLFNRLSRMAVRIRRSGGSDLRRAEGFGEKRV